MKLGNAIIIITIFMIILVVSVSIYAYVQIAPIWQENWENCKSISEEKGAYEFHAYLDASCRLKICDDDISKIQIDNTTFRKQCKNWEYEYWGR